MQTKIIDKIRQLRTLSVSNNANEAAAAAAAADRLISKYRICEAEVALADKASDLPAEEDKFVLYETARVTRWKQVLAMRLAEHYGCAIWNDCVWASIQSGRKVSRLRLVGLQSDMEITRYMFAWLTLEIERLSKSHCVGRGHVYAASYCLGAVNGIKQQLDLVKQEQKVDAEASGQTTALACLDERITKASLTMKALHKLVTTKVVSHGHHDANAYKLGVEVGKSIHIGKVMGSSNTDGSKMLK